MGACFKRVVRKVDKAKDPYSFHSTTLPIVEAAIRGEIVDSIDLDEIRIISGNYRHDVNEGILAQEYDREFTRAIAGFSVTLQGLSLEQTEKIVKNGITYGWVDCEEEGDWPDKVKYP